MLRETLGIMRELPRLHEIAAVFIRHGLGDFVQRIGIAGVLERAGQMLHWGRRRIRQARPGRAPAPRARGARPDVREARAGDGHARGSVPAALDFRVREAARRGRRPCRSRRCCRVSSALSAARPSRCSATSRRSAHAAASIAQVHRARLADGTPVVLKDTAARACATKIDADLRLLRRIAELIESEMPEARRYRPVEIAVQFARSLEREARLRHRDAQHRALRQELRRRPARRHPAHLSGMDERHCCSCRSTSRASRRPISRRSKPRASTAGSSRRAAPKRSSA